MAQSDTIYNDLRGILNEYRSYTPVDTTDIYRNLISRVDNMRPQYDELGRINAQAYAAPGTLMNQYYQTYGTDPLTKGPSAAANLASIMQSMGRLYGSGDALRGSIDAQKGRLEDLANSVQGTYGLQQEALWKRYQGLLPLYQAQLSKEEAARSRAAAYGAANKKATVPKPPAMPSTTYTGEVDPNIIGLRPDGTPIYAKTPSSTLDKISARQRGGLQSRYSQPTYSSRGY